jgi:hypothetical protein
MDHRVREPLYDRAVEPSVLADDAELDLFSRSISQVADHSRKPRKELVDRDHTQIEGGVPHLAADSFERLESVHPGFDARDLAQPKQVICDHDQLTGEPDQVIELAGVNPDPGVQAR